MICSFELDDKETEFVETYLKRTNQVMEELAKKTLIEYVLDVEEAEKAWAEYEKDPVTYTHEEMGKRLGLA